MRIQDCILQDNSKLAVIGLGYVGLPLAMSFAKHIPVIGYDINEERLAVLRSGKDPNRELSDDAFIGVDIEFTSSVQKLKEASVYIVAVPTPIDDHNYPNLNFLLRASETVGSVLKKGDFVVFESTVYPGCTEEDCIPVIETISGLKSVTDFKYGYSPERINPGDKVHTLANTVKIVSGCDEEALDYIAGLYALVVEQGIYRAPNVKVAEAAKIIENTQRDVNIALMNELSILFSRMGINTYDVIEAASTKWNFLPFYPGLVGGHCIGVDPYYLVYKASELKYHTQVISAGRYVNDTMGGYIGKKVVKQIISFGKSVQDSRILVMGITFKENVSDIRNSKVINIVNELKDYGVTVDIMDPFADPRQVKQMYSLDLVEQPQARYDAIIVAVAHKDYQNLTEDFFISHSNDHGLLVDIKGIYRNRIHQLHYWSL